MISSIPNLLDKSTIKFEHYKFKLNWFMLGIPASLKIKIHFLSISINKM